MGAPFIATLVIILFMLNCVALGSDPDPLHDFCIADNAQQEVFLNGFPCKNPTLVSPLDFKSSLLKKAGNASNPLGVSINLASAATFGALNTQGLSFARIDYAKGAVVPPHVHPRASEVIFVARGTLSVAFVDSNNNLFASILEPGDLYVFPRGLVHYSMNVGKGPALSFSSLNSQNPGASLLANALFTTTPTVSNGLLEKAFHLSDKEINRLRKVLGGG